MPVSLTKALTTNLPSLPGGAVDANRRAHTRLRRRILGGPELWIQDLARHMQQLWDPTRRQIMGKPDTSTNLMKTVVDQLSVLYTRHPILHHEDSDAMEVVNDAMDEGGWWTMADSLQSNVLGLRESFVRPSITKEGKLRYRIVTPDEVYAEAPVDEPDLPNLVVEAKTREVNGEDIWTNEVLDLRDPANPIWKIVTTDKNKPKDLTEMFLGDNFSGANYPFRTKDGVPVMPYVIYHGKRTGKLFDPFELGEVVEGTLTVAGLWTFWSHGVRDASWPQRWTINAILRGTSTKGRDYSNHSAVTTDPASVLQFKSDGVDGASIGQFQAGADPEILQKAISDFESRLAVHFRIGPSDFERGTAESGYAISLKRASVREAQASFEPMFRRSDTALIALSALLLNRQTGSSLPEDGYGIVYPGLPRTDAEIEASLLHHEKLIELGLESKVDAFLDLHPGMSREAALARLTEVAAENRQLL